MEASKNSYQPFGLPLANILNWPTLMTFFASRLERFTAFLHSFEFLSPRFFALELFFLFFFSFCFFFSFFFQYLYTESFPRRFVVCSIFTNDGRYCSRVASIFTRANNELCSRFRARPRENERSFRNR